MSRDRVIHIDGKVANYFRLSTMKADADGKPIEETRRYRTGWFKNLITNYGMDMLAHPYATNSGIMRACRVGSGSTAPAYTDTNLESPVATTADRFVSSVTRDLGASPPFWSFNRTFRFAAGAAAGNLTEVGMVGAQVDGSSTGGATNPATNVSTRALIFDEFGSPTTVTVLSDEVLDVEASVRTYIPVDDVTGTITLDGNDYDYVVRPCFIDVNPGTNSGGWGQNSGLMGPYWDIRASGGYGENQAFVGSTSGITTQTGGRPLGTAVNSNPTICSLSTPAYVAGSHYIDIKHAWQLGPAPAAGNINDPNGIGALMFSSYVNSFQVGFTPRIPKTNEYVFEFTLRFHWARA